MRYDAVMDCKHLSCEMISRASADQRAGRAGRTQNGHCYRLYSRNVYESMAVFTEPEILRTSLIEICLNAKLLQIPQSISEFLSQLIDPPSENCITASINLLKYRQLLNDDETLTKLGFVAASMPVHCKFAKAIVMSIALRCLESVAYIVCMLSTKPPFRTTANYDENAAVGPDNIRAIQKICQHRMCGDNWATRNPGKTMSIYDIPGIVGYCRVLWTPHFHLSAIQTSRLVFVARELYR